MVRTFQTEDARAVEEILRKSPEAAVWPAGSLEKLNQRGELAWVIEGFGVVTGFLAARALAEEAEILNLSVDPARRRTGNASALLQKALADLQGLRAVRIFLEVRKSNFAAIAFYAKHGFLKTGERPGYYRDPNEPAILMRRDLTG